MFLAGRPERTREAYRRDLVVFADRLGTVDVAQAIVALLMHGPGPANALVIAYRAHLVESGLAPASVNRRLATLRSLVAMARTVGLVSWQLDVGNVRSHAYRETRGPGDVGVRLLLEVATGQLDWRKSTRDVALVRLLHDVALRRGEVSRLDVADLDLERQRIALVGKGQNEHSMVSLPAATCEAIVAWLDARGSEPGPLFLSLDCAGRRRQDGRLSGSGIWVIIRDLGRKACIEAWPHGLRHTAITRALDATNGDLRKVQRFSRHRDVRTVMIYDDNRTDLGLAVADLVAMPRKRV
jgi:integrase/recombinase XerC